MYDIIKILFDICLFKKGPQDLPYSVWLLRILLVIYVSIRILMLSIHFDWLNVLLQVIVEIFLVAGFIWIILYLARKLGRFYQVLSAVLGTDALISFFALPAIASMETGQGGLLVFLVMLGVIGWYWAVTGHIFRNALEQSLIFSLGLAFLYLLGSYQVIALLFPEVTGVK
ncbi:MAG: hypothetical protein PHD43_01050 [Methylococcales bacterium]|nr:hypothetical protein [Methylococcales bacterium]